jgi:hypothetical protein
MVRLRALVIATIEKHGGLVNFSVFLWFYATFEKLKLNLLNQL